MRIDKRPLILSLFAVNALIGCALDTAPTTGRDPAGSNGSHVCAAPDPATVTQLKELMIVDPSVVTSVAASNDAGESGGALSFNRAMTRLAGPGIDVATFTEAFLRNWEVEHTVGAGTVPATPNGGLQALLSDPGFWPRLADGHLDMKRAPFRLLAVVNRMDLASAAKPNGEGRLVFGAVSPGGTGVPMTLIFEYNLPSGPEHTKTAWAERWHALGALPFGQEFNDALSSLAECYTAGEDLSQLRSSEVFLSGRWVLREFHLDLQAHALVTATTAQTPDRKLNNSAKLIDWVNANEQTILNNTHVVPEELLGGVAEMAFPGGPTFNVAGTQWLMSDSGQPLVNDAVRHTFASQTCNGCHQSDVPNGQQIIDGFYQVSPVRPASGDGTSRLSSFILQAELPRRAALLAGLVSCSSM